MRGPTIPRLLLAGAFLGGIAFAAYYARAVLPQGDILPGVRVDGVEIPAKVSTRAFIEQRAHALLSRRVRLMAPDDSGGHVLKEATLGELGVEVDVDRVLHAARAIAKGADLVTEHSLVRAARAGRFDIPLLPVVNAKAALPVLESFKEPEDAPPIPARLDLDRHTVVAERDGRYLDVDAGIAALQRVATQAASYPEGAVINVVVPTEAWKPRLSSEFLSKIDIHEVVSSFETTFSRSQVNRSRNVEVAAAHVNGTVLSPGASMSFNDVVGARSMENGFQKAGEIFKGEMVEGVGGGTCQVASTLHAAAFFGGLDVLERLPHSRASAYVKLGLDATVVYPVVDLKLRNPFDFPVVVHAFVEGQKIKVELLGKKKPVRVSYEMSVVGSSNYTRKVVEEPSVDKPLIKQHGSKGLTIRRVRTMIFEGGEKRVETTIDTYPPVIEICKVPPGFDKTDLPALGEDESATTTTPPTPPAKHDPYAASQRQG